MSRSLDGRLMVGSDYGLDETGSVADWADLG